ncbi:Leishmanolysin-like peptidase [Sciurus carolinensis]|uniref:Leishmanolysin-like peptidase n=1 Tax=Sciurus carolinensis TaxID=30640 RepID=A0AA41MMV5_SCICA|nr:Leishmanolysin-like peptidase [Sciurus carolinensis]
MAAEWGGGGYCSGSGPGPSRWSWSASLWVRGVLLLLGGLPASTTSVPVSVGTSPPCRHHVPSDTEVINKVHLKTNHVVKRDVDEHLRIKTVYDKSIEELLPEKRHLVKQCRVCRGGKWPCGAVGMLDQEGVQDADFVLYVGALATERCRHENIISYAAYCQQEAKMDSLGLYQWSDKVVRKVERSWNVRDNKIVHHTVYLLVTPRVVDEARKHFNCPILEGMELENQGGMGTELNHWEKRLLENEAMTGSHTQNRVLSRITLALMEDTGWYKANYSMAEKLDWGRGMGCDFVRKSCKFWIDQQRQKRQMLSPYCDTLRSNPLQLTCRQDQRAVAVCNLQKFPKPLPPEYQYFDELSGIPAEDLPYYGGSVEIADYCPFSQEFSWHLSGEYQRSSDCRILENQPEIFKNYGAEKYGPHSVCLIQKSAFVMEKCERKLSYPDWGSGCYQISCSLQGLMVWVQDTSYLCSRAGQVLPVSIQMNGWIHEGNLLCPSCWDFCEQCPPETDPPVANLTRALPLGEYSLWLEQRGKVIKGTFPLWCC